MSAPLFYLAAWSACLAQAPSLDRPQWMDQPGIVMAGNWEEPTFRARAMGRTDYTLPPEKLADYAREHSPEMIAQLKELGVNFLMIHCYKGAGFKTEQAGIEDAKRFADLAHRAGMRVGTYIGGTMLYERLFDEEPNARQWQALGPRGEPQYYNPKQQFRYTAVRNHPGFIEYLKKPVRLAIEDVHADLIHFDNFGSGAASYDPFSKQQFRAFLHKRGKAPADPPLPTEPDTSPLVREWKDYKCQALADHYAAMARYIRALRPTCAVECNPGGVTTGGGAVRGIDHARLLPLGNAFWDEAWGAEWSEKTGSARTRIRSLKVGELFNNSTFLYCESALDLAESMAFNVNCLGTVSWFEWGKIATAHLTGRALPAELKTYIRFFLDHQDLYRHWPSVADVAVLRTFAEQSAGRRGFMAVEQALIQSHVAWRIIFDQQLDDLAGYRVLVVPDDAWLTAEQQEKIGRFVKQGGRAVRSTDIAKPDAFPQTIRDRLRAVVDAPRSVALELRQQAQPDRALVHLVNYHAEQTIEQVRVRLRLKSGAPRSVRLLSPDPATARPLPFDTTSDGCEFTVPQLKIYAAVIIDGVAL